MASSAVGTRYVRVGGSTPGFVPVEEFMSAGSGYTGGELGDTGVGAVPAWEGAEEYEEDREGSEAWIVPLGVWHALRVRPKEQKEDMAERLLSQVCVVLEAADGSLSLARVEQMLWSVLARWARQLDLDLVSVDLPMGGMEQSGTLTKPELILSYVGCAQHIFQQLEDSDEPGQAWHCMCEDLAGEPEEERCAGRVWQLVRTHCNRYGMEACGASGQSILSSMEEKRGFLVWGPADAVGFGFFMGAIAFRLLAEALEEPELEVICGAWLNFCSKHCCGAYD